MSAGTGWKIVLVLMLAASAAHATDAPAPPPKMDEVEASVARYKQAQIALFDALRSDASPAQQVLAGRLYVDDDDTPSALRPKSADVVVRAAALAPDDAFVQWVGADVGAYYSSKCGPTRWPEPEVANLVRMEPDNAGALQYAVALAHAKGDQTGIDDALARMASARRADDHLGDEVAAWARAYAAHPVASPFEDATTDAATPSDALSQAVRRTALRSSPVEAAVEEACTPAADNDRTWRRLGWCADAGVLLATHGNSFGLRALGLKMLTAAGATREDLADLQRQFDWLKANAASPMQNGEAFSDAPADRAADWNAAPSEIGATERRLKRLGKPLAPLPGWAPHGDDDDVSDADQTAGNAWQAYLKSLFAAMQASGDVHERALALSQMPMFERFWSGVAATGDKADSAFSSTSELARFAAAHPDDAIVQWIAATAPTATTIANPAIANIQRLESDNGAAWALSLDAASSGELLQRMGQAKRFDDHSTQILGLWLAALRRNPLPADAAAVMATGESADVNTPQGLEFAAAMSLGMAGMNTAPWGQVFKACKALPTQAPASSRDGCVHAGRLLLHESTSLIGASFGKAILRTLDSLDARDLDRARQLDWWRESLLISTGDAVTHYAEDYLSTGSEIEAMRLAATRAGKAEPPAEWKSQSEQQAAKSEAKQDATSH
jgi:hypothetical protein